MSLMIFKMIFKIIFNIIFEIIFQIGKGAEYAGVF